MKRPPEAILSAILLVLVALAALVLTLLNIGVGDAAELPSGMAQMPAGGPDLEQIMQTARMVSIGMLSVVLAASIAAGLGLWGLRKWGWWLALILAVLKILGNVAVFFMPAAPITPLGFAQLAVGLIVLILLLLRDTREAVFPEKR